jgi:hypothetical protein
MSMHEDERVMRDDALGQALRALPLSPAPKTLAPRVMAAVAARLKRHDYTWFEWPVWAQIASAIGLVVLFAGGAAAWSAISTPAALETDASLLRALFAVGRSVLQPMMTMFLLAVTGLMLLAGTCAALLNRVVFGSEDMTEMVR